MTQKVMLQNQDVVKQALNIKRTMNTYNAFMERSIKHVQHPATNALRIYQYWSLFVVVAF